MHLHDFDTFIENIILKRGWDYYRNECISSIRRTAENTFNAEVAGTDDYLVTVKLDDDGGILSSGCTCPYDMGPYCKHEAAVFYALREMLEQPAARQLSNIDNKADHNDKASHNGKADRSPHGRIKEILSNRSREELAEFLAAIAAEYEEIADRIELDFARSNNDDELKKYVKLIQTYLRQHSDPDGFISFREAAGAVEGARMALKKADDAAASGESLHALDLYLCVLREMASAIQYADDSNGYIGGVIEETLNAIEILVNEEDLPSDVTVSETIFKKLLEESANDLYDGWSDWQLSLLSSCSDLATTPERRKAFESHLDSMEDKADDDSWSSGYMLQRISMIRYQMISDFDGKDRAEEYLEEHLDLPDFREMAIKDALERQDYPRAEKLALQGEKHDTGLYGLVKKWKQFRYEACRLSGQVDKQRDLALELTLEGSFEYYLNLKHTYPEGEWKTVYPEIISRMEARREHHDTYTRILIEEGELQKLLDYVRARPFYIDRFYTLLIPAFAEEVYEIFARQIFEEASRASSRNGYREVCSLIQTLAEAGGREQAREIAQSLLEKYPRKPAFKEELLKLHYSRN
ncbi:MAG: SWIM zinc finger family protein [Firmicutes bacterium]|nr:SWIM zinc finger family protein [Bacillota bacterium]